MKNGIYEIFVSDTKIKNKSLNEIEKIINFNGERNFIYIKTVEKNKALLDDIVIYVLCTIINGYERAYVSNEKTENIAIYINSINERFRVEVKEINKESNLSDLVEIYFKGNSYYTINETPNEIKKEYGGNKDLMQILLLVVLVFVLLIIGYFVYDSVSPKITKVIAPIPEPIAKPLTKNELNNLKRVATPAIINEISKKVDNIYTNNDYKTRKKVMDFNLNYEVKPAVKAVQKNDGSWYFPHEPRRGALKPKMKYIFEETYPEVGYRYVSDGIYSKTDNTSLFYSEDNKTKKLLPITKKCIFQLINKDFNSYVYFREHNDIEIFFKNTNPSALLKNMYKVVKNCPVYFQRLAIRNSKAEGSVILFRAEKD